MNTRLLKQVLHILQRSRLRRPISKIRMVLPRDAIIWMTSLMIMFAVRPTCVQDSLFKMSSESPVLVHYMETNFVIDAMVQLELGIYIKASMFIQVMWQWKS